MAIDFDDSHGEALLSPEQVARICGLSRRAVYDAIKRGDLRAFRICSRLRISTDHLDAWLSESAVAGSPEPARPETRAAATRELVRRGSFRAKLAASREHRE
jgi:excisionase family DNA binding protein